MAAPLRNPKALTEWLELDYHERPRRLRRLKVLLSVAMLVGCVVLIGATWLHPRGKLVYEAGPVSDAHTMYGRDCGQCHREYLQTAKRLWVGNSGLHSVADETCRSCHQAPAHHGEQMASPDCASCHREHRGPSLLAQVTDGHCTKCHSDLGMAKGESKFPHVSAFTADHPYGSEWKFGTPADPGTIRFNHQKHLQGIRHPNQGEVRLECTSCHTLDPAGRYMLPIKYERHCGECHPLNATLVGDWADKDLQTAAQIFRKIPAPHPSPSQGADVVRGAVRDRLVRFVKEHPNVLKTPALPEPTRPIPGRRGPEPLSGEEWNWVQAQLERAERALFDQPDGCIRCHKEITEREKRSAGIPQYAKSNILNPWLPHATFSHLRHQTMLCEKCHEGVGDSKQSSDVLMPKNVGMCVNCHSSQAGVRHDCALCHRYHPWNEAPGKKLPGDHPASPPK